VLAAVTGAIAAGRARKSWRAMERLMQRRISRSLSSLANFVCCGWVLADSGVGDDVDGLVQRSVCAPV